MTWTSMDIHAWRIQVASLTDKFYSVLPLLSPLSPLPPLPPLLPLPPLPPLPHNIDFSLSTISSLSSILSFSSISSDGNDHSLHVKMTELFKEMVECLGGEIERLKAEAEEMEWQRDSAIERAAVLRQKCAMLEGQVNAKEKEKEKQSRTWAHGLIMTNGARQRIAQDDAKRAEMRRKAGEAKERRQDKAAALNVQQGAMDGMEIFKGSLSSKSKAQLQDIATALSLSTDGIKVEIMKRIKEYLDSSPNLRHDQRFAGLYSSRGRRRGLNLNITQPITQGDVSHAAPVAGPSQCWIDYSAVQHAPACMWQSHTVPMTQP